MTIDSLELQTQWMWMMISYAAAAATATTEDHQKKSEKKQQASVSLTFYLIIRSFAPFCVSQLFGVGIFETISLSMMCVCVWCVSDARCTAHECKHPKYLRCIGHGPIPLFHTFFLFVHSYFYISVDGKPTKNCLLLQRYGSEMSSSLLFGSVWSASSGDDGQMHDRQGNKNIGQKRIKKIKTQNALRKLTEFGSYISFGPQRERERERAECKPTMMHRNVNAWCVFINRCLATNMHFVFVCPSLFY